MGALTTRAPTVRVALLVLLSLALAGAAHAAELRLDPVVDLWNSKRAEIMGRVIAVGKATLMLLITLDLVWSAGQWAMEKDNLASLGAELVRKLMHYGLALWLLTAAPEWVPVVINSFVKVGQIAGGDTTGSMSSLSPDQIFGKGRDLIGLFWSGTGRLLGVGMAVMGTGLAAGLAFSAIPFVGTVGVAVVIITVVLVVVLLLLYLAFNVIVSAAIIWSYGLLILQILLMSLEGALLLGLGVVLLAFGGNPWLREYSSRYFNYLIGLGMRFAVLTLTMSVIGVGYDLSAEARSGLNQDYWIWIADHLPSIPIPNPVPYVMLALQCVAEALLVAKAPDLVAALMQGGSGLTPSSVGSSLSGFKSTLQQMPSEVKGGLQKAKSLAMGSYAAGKFLTDQTTTRARSRIEAGAVNAMRGWMNGRSMTDASISTGAGGFGAAAVPDARGGDAIGQGVSGQASGAAAPVAPTVIQGPGAEGPGAAASPDAVQRSRATTIHKPPQRSD